LALVGHLEEEEKGELFDVVAIGEAVIAEDVAVVPKPLDNGRRAAERLTSLSDWTVQPAADKSRSMVSRARSSGVKGMGKENVSIS
jgi:hypothetical protein